MSRFPSLAALFLAFLFVAPGAAAFDEKEALKASQEAIGRQLGNYRFVSSEGKDVTLAGLRGKPLVVSFIYTGCFQVCPASTQFLAKAVEEAERTLGRGAFRVASIGFNLPFDSPAAMKDFRRRFALSSPEWLFLTPDAAELERLAADFGFRYEATAAGFDHLLQASIVDAEGRIYRQVYGDAFEVPLFVGPLVELAQSRARAPSVSSSLEALWEDVKILCTVYDASAGRYRLNYAIFIELFAGATVILAALFFVGREWRRRRAAA